MGGFVEVLASRHSPFIVGGTVNEVIGCSSGGLAGSIKSTALPSNIIASTSSQVERQVPAVPNYLGISKRRPLNAFP